MNSGFKKSWLAVLIILLFIVPTHAATISSGGHIIKDASSTYTQRPNIKVTGAASVSDNGADTTIIDVTTVAVPAANYYVAGHMSPAELKNTNKTEGGSATSAVNGGALRFDGTDDWVSIADQTALDPTNMSVSFWIYSPTNTTGVILSHSSSTGGGTGYRVVKNAGTSGTIIQLTSNTGNTTANTVEMTLNTWYHVTVTASSTTGRNIYYNGNATPVYTDATNYSMVNSDCDVRIGRRTTTNCTTYDTGSYLKGIVDDLRVYSSIISASDISTLYNSGYGQSCAGGQQTGLVSCWGLDETSGTTATDSTSSYNGTLTNFPITTYQTTSASTVDSGWATDPWRVSSKCKLNTCVSFDGVNDYAEVRPISDVDVVNNWTIESWAFLRINNATQSLIEKYDNASGKGGYAMRVSSTGKLVGIAVSGTDTTTNVCTGSTTLTTYTWYHLAIKFNDSTNTITCLVNGVEDNVNSLATAIVYSSSVHLIFGAIGTGGGTQYFNGTMDEIAIWGTDLSTSIILGHYTTPAELVGNESNIKAVWHVNDNAGILLSQTISQTGIGDDTYNCTSSSTPCKTIQAAVNKIPKFFAGSSTLNIASGIYPEEVTMRGFNPSGDFLLTVQGFINSTPNSFTDVASISDTSSGSNTALFPKDDRSLFKDTGVTFTADSTGAILKLTGGTGWKDDSSAYDWTNWYRVECAWGTACDTGTLNNLSVVTVWSVADGGYALPDNTTTYKVYYEKYMTQIHGGGDNRYLFHTYNDGVRETNMTIRDSAGIAIRKMRFSGAQAYALRVTTSSLDEVSTSTFDKSNYAGLWFEDSFVSDVISNNYTKNRNEGFILFQNSGATFIRKNMSLENNGPGFAGYFSSSYLVMTSYLAKNNTQNNFDIETNSQALLTSYVRSDQTLSGNFGIAINGMATFGVIGPFTHTGNINNIGILVRANSSFTGYGLTSGSQIEIKNSKTGIEVSSYSGCKSDLSKGCQSYTFSGNTVNFVVGEDSGVESISESNHIMYVSEYDDFMSGNTASGSVGKMGWVITADVAGTLKDECNGTTTVSGCIGIITSTTNPSYIMLSLKDKSLVTGLLDGSKNFETTAIVRCINAGTNICEFGLAYTNDWTKYIKFKSDISQTYWYAVNYDGTTTATTITTVARSTSLWYKLKIRQDRGTIQYYIDDVLVATHSTGVPTSQLQPYFYQYTSSVATKGMLIDFWSITMPSPGR